MPLILGPEDVKQAGNISLMIDVVEEGLREQAEGRVVMPVRQNLETSGGFFRVMPCVMRDSGKMGLKVFNYSADTGVRYLIIIYDERSGELLCMLDAAWLTAARTGATTGVATRYLARRNARTAGVIGSGLEARTNLAAVCAVRPIESATVYSPNPENRERFASEMSETLGIPITAEEDAESAVRNTDVVIVATNTTGKSDVIAYRGEWMQEGQHVNSIGATGGKLREIDPTCFARSELILVDSEVQVRGESGDAFAAIDAGVWDPSRIIELPGIVRGTSVGRKNDQQITLFKSVGTAVQDVMAGFAVYDEARRLGVGNFVPDFLERKLF